MANSDASDQSMIANDEENNLRYLEFVQVAALNTMVCLSNLYDYAKESSGPLKPGVEIVEGTIKTVVGPVFDQYHDVPIEFLKFVDRKVDESICKVSHVPLNVSDVYYKYEPTAKQLYSKYEPVAEQYAVSTWQKLNQLPLFPRVAQVMVPTAAYCSEKYNQTVLSTAKKGYAISSYLPLVPTEKIGQMFGNDKDN